MPVCNDDQRTHQYLPPCLQVHIGSYFLKPGPGAANPGPVQVLDCVRSVAHPSWSFQTTQNDIALCFLSGRAQVPPVVLADGKWHL